MIELKNVFIQIKDVKNKIKFVKTLEMNQNAQMILFQIKKKNSAFLSIMHVKNNLKIVRNITKKIQLNRKTVNL